MREAEERTEAARLALTVAWRDGWTAKTGEAFAPESHFAELRTVAHKVAADAHASGKDIGELATSAVAAFFVAKAKNKFVAVKWFTDDPMRHVRTGGGMMRPPDVQYESTAHLPVSPDRFRKQARNG